MTIVLPHLPAGNVAGIFLHSDESSPVRSQHREISRAPVVPIKDVDIGLSIAIKVADEMLVVAAHRPVGKRISVQLRHSQASARGSQHAEISRTPIQPVVDKQIRLAVAGEITDIVDVVLVHLPAGQVGIIASYDAESRSAGFEKSEIPGRVIERVRDEQIFLTVTVE